MPNNETERRQDCFDSSLTEAGTWEEKNLNSRANGRIKDLLGSLDSLEFPTGKASIYEVSKCSGNVNG
ncbi:hypothetical protein EJB05_13722, partial [Eragrostis curvula]